MTQTILISIGLFILFYAISGLFVSVIYHRALCHQALKLDKTFEKFIFFWGFIITGIDPAIWIANHRLHHLHSDTQLDPHSPKFKTSFKAMNDAHLEHYSRMNRELKDENSESSRLIKDLPYGLHPLMRLPEMPLLHISWGNAIVYILHLCLYFLIFKMTGEILYPLAIGTSLLSHPVQGLLVNYYGHKVGYRNYETNDESTNNTLIAFFIFGEGNQNNHHHDPKSAKLSVKKNEFDSGYWMVKVLRFFSLVH